jgi:hypothetical protein
LLNYFFGVLQVLRNKTQSFNCMTLSNLSIYVVFVDPHQGNNNVMPSLPTTKAYSGAHKSGNNKEEHTYSSYIVKSNNGSKESKVIQSNQDVHMYRIRWIGVYMVANPNSIFAP